MEGIDKLRQAFIKEASKHGPAAFYDAVVLDVDSDAYSCNVTIDDEITLHEVRLRAVISDNQSIDVLPAVGAQVVIGKMADDDYIVIACDQISSYRVTVGAVVFTIDDTGTLISNGTETLKKILTDLVTAVMSIGAPKDMATLTELLIRINTLLK
jgi:hypothetical protein